VKAKVLIAMALGAAGLAGIVLATGSDHFEHGPAGVTKAGGFCVSDAEETLVTVDDSVTGEAASASYAVGAGLVHAFAFDGQWLWAADQPSPPVLGGTGSATLPWASSRSGNYEILIGETVLTSGTFAADDVVDSTVLSADLPADDYVDVVVKATAGGDAQGLSYRLFNDRSAPSFKGLALTEVKGTLSATYAPGATEVEVLVPGQPDDTAPVAGGGFKYALPAGTTALTLEAENAFGRTCRRDVELDGVPTPAPGLTLVGRTIFWPTKLGEAEVQLDPASQDVKGKLAGAGVLRLPGDPAQEIPLATLKGKLSQKASKKGNKLKLTLKTAKGVDPKTKVTIKGYWVDGRIVMAKVVVNAKKVFKGKYIDVSFDPLVDAGNPIAVTDLALVGTAEDSRAGSRVTVLTGDGTFEGDTTVGFTDSLTGAFGSTLIADDDAAPPNRGERPVRAVVE